MLFGKASSFIQFLISSLLKLVGSKSPKEIRLSHLFISISLRCRPLGKHLSFSQRSIISHSSNASLFNLSPIDSSFGQSTSLRTLRVVGSMSLDDKDVRLWHSSISRRLSMVARSTIVDTHFRDGQLEIFKCSRRDALLLPMLLRSSSFIYKEEVEEAPPSSITNSKDSKAVQPLIVSVLNVDFNLIFTRLWHDSIMISIARRDKDVTS